MGVDSLDDNPDHHRERSNYVRNLVQKEDCARGDWADSRGGVPRTIVQFWHNREHLPADVDDCIESWRLLGRSQLSHILFDEREALAFIHQNLGERHAKAFERCYHPAMQSDYFRLCYILVEGGFYVDVDDVYTGIDILPLFDDGRLKIQPLCYDITTATMVSPSIFMKPGNHSDSWIYYFNNNPLIASAHHPIVERALSMATRRLERGAANCVLPEIQSTTGPGNFTEAIFALASEYVDMETSLCVMPGWEGIAATRWHLSYRNDHRNWRLSNQRLLPGAV